MTFSVFLDFAASLAVLALLAESYGVIRRRFVGAFAAPIVLGVLFGLMAVVQMHRPFEPFDGVIIDMRNVPIALAGAFLGWRGLLPCLGIAVATRMGIGGVGMVSGIAAMAMSGLARDDLGSQNGDPQKTKLRHAPVFGSGNVVPPVGGCRAAKGRGLVVLYHCCGPDPCSEPIGGAQCRRVVGA